MLSRKAVGLCLLLLVETAGCGQPEEYDSTTRALRVCPEGETLEGIDVSHHQGTVDWDRVASRGISFAFIRVSDGLYTLDRQFERNWTEAKRVGIIRGVYQFFRPNQNAVAQAELLLERIGWHVESGDLPPVIDVEVSGGRSRSQVVAAVRAWVDRVEEAVGVKPIIYTSPGLWDSIAASSEFGDYPLWVAHYYTSCPRMPTGWDSWVFHQYTDSGYVSGAGTVDRNRFNGSLADLQAFVVQSGEEGPECGDGVCSPGEECEADCGCQAVPADGRVIDEQDPCFEAGGDDRWWREEEAGWDGHLLWTHTVSTRVYNYGVWHLTFQQAGTYRVEVFTPAPWSESRQARYQVRHAGTVDVVVVDQTAHDGWQELGTFRFQAGGDQWIRLEDLTGEPNATNTQIVFDAVRLVPATEPTEPTEGADWQPEEVDLPAGGAGAGTAEAPEERPAGESGLESPPSGGSIVGGCAQAPRPLAAWWLLGLVGLLAVRRRRR